MLDFIHKRNAIYKYIRKKSVKPFYTYQRVKIQKLATTWLPS